LPYDVVLDIGRRLPDYVEELLRELGGEQGGYIKKTEIFDGLLEKSRRGQIASQIVPPDAISFRKRFTDSMGKQCKLRNPRFLRQGLSKVDVMYALNPEYRRALTGAEIESLKCSLSYPLSALHLVCWFIQYCALCDVCRD